MNKQKQKKIEPDLDRVVKIPRTTARNKITIDTNLYVTSITDSQFKTIVSNVVEIKETAGGRVKAFGKEYKCTNKQAELLDRLLFFCFGANLVICGHDEKDS
ncbi:MAG: hypothetical protein H8E55_08435 [Pelagibacterales bacterium]|nr:hypothetical protein [Pelagibacterales bacterium]